MRILGLDLETTGLDTSKERITELGLVLWDVEDKQPITTNGFFFYDDTFPEITPEITRLTGIHQAMLREFGVLPGPALKWLDEFCARHRVEYIVAHNGENFDRPLLMAELTRHGVDAPTLRSLPWIDTRTDIPFAEEPRSRSLNHLATDAGFLNPFAHRAVFDVCTMLRLLSGYDIQKVLEYQRIPFVVCRAVVGFAEKEKAKALRYSWERIGEKVYPKLWIKRIKENLLAKEQAACKLAGFQCIQIE